MEIEYLNADLLHRAAIGEQVHLIETDLEASQVLQNEQAGAVQGEEWAHSQAPFPRVGQHPQ